MADKLLIVESPAKAKTIEKYLDGNFTVKSSYGHVRDLDKGDKGIDIEKDFTPKYIVSPEKTKVVNELKKAVKKVKEVWLATDEDREGEAISWHLCEVLGLDVKNTKRIVFHEITKNALQKAIETPRTVDLNLVKAQQARRILDRLVGFRLSEVLWRKVRNKLSAGRVQSVAVKLIVDREREIKDFETAQFYKVYAVFNVLNGQGQQVELKAEIKSKFQSRDEAYEFLEGCVDGEFSISNITKKPVKKKPAAPFTTSTLQQDASIKLGYGVSRTMSIAQRLYEQGLITYMRTDSINLSNLAISTIANEITRLFGEPYVQVRKYKTKNASAQEAHEAIRPTYIDRRVAGQSRDEERLYDLIWKRAVASQMANAELEKTLVDIDISGVPDKQFVAEGEVLKFDGFLKLYLESKVDDQEDEVKGMLPKMDIGQQLDLHHITALQKFSKPPARYSEASLVKKMEELGIGRPSTYAPTISRITEKSRGYVTKESREGVVREYEELQLQNNKISSVKKTEKTGVVKNRLFASDIGMVVTDFLGEHFDDVMNYGFTADIESKFDEIANGDLAWVDMIKSFYGPFKESVDETLEKANKAKGRRDLGIDSETGHTILVQLTRFGPVAQIGTREEVGEEGKPKFANLKIGQSLETITIEEVKELFKLPRNLGQYEDQEVIIGAGRFGPYVKWGDKFISIPRDEDPLSLSEQRAHELIELKKKEDAPIAYHEEKPITKGKGRFGPFVKWNNLFVNIPRKYNPDTLTAEEAQELVKLKIEKEANRYIHNWPDLDVSVQNGRWGPFIKYKKKNIKLPKVGDARMTPEQAKDLTLDQVKELVEKELPGSFSKKKTKKSPKKKSKK